jgi:hypothetical protein
LDRHSKVGPVTLTAGGSIVDRFEHRFGLGIGMAKVQTIITTPQGWGRSRRSKDPAWIACKRRSRVVAARLILVPDDPLRPGMAIRPVRSAAVAGSYRFNFAVGEHDMLVEADIVVASPAEWEQDPRSAGASQPDHADLWGVFADDGLVVAVALIVPRAALRHPGAATWV